MKRYMYPAVLYVDGDEYAFIVNDLSISGSGSTIEEAYEEVSDFLDRYIDTALRFDSEIPDASNVDEIIASKQKNKIPVMIVSVVSDKKEKGE